MDATVLALFDEAHEPHEVLPKPMIPTPGFASCGNVGETLRVVMAATTRPLITRSLPRVNHEANDSVLAAT